MDAVLFALPASHPCAAVERALTLKGVAYRRIELIPGPHRIVQKAVFGATTVPAVRLSDGTKVVGSRPIMRALDERVPEPRLVPDSAGAARAEEWGDQVLQSLVGDMQQRFVGLVRERRPNLSEEMKAEMIDGRVFSANQALAGGLVDDIGYLDATIDRARQRAGVSEASVIRYRRSDEYADSLYDRAKVGGAQVNMVNFNIEPLPRTPSFLYLWAP